MAVTLRYKKGISLLHKVPAGVKLAMLPCCTFIIMLLSEHALIICSLCCTLAALLCGWTLRELYADVRPALYYALLLASASLINAVIASPGILHNGIEVLKPENTLLVYTGRLLCVMQFSALLFRTTTNIQIKDAICTAEVKLRTAFKALLPFARNISDNPRFGIILALTLNFIPEIFNQWQILERAWNARGGRGYIAKMRILLFALISRSFYAAAQKSRALAARKLL
ncbi:MAG: energy-coupling factor transporter transmembrane protein EcfT [Spirochaetaceae bacterium]|jgi:biotin transport system permease protein/energy-coupling factor transport system permease protein|nr:energy-coupling factor transporter transmembrane protein EcfT [Spirochaetaceae bacterium]